MEGNDNREGEGFLRVVSLNGKSVDVYINPRFSFRFDGRTYRQRCLRMDLDEVYEVCPGLNGKKVVNGLESRYDGKRLWGLIKRRLNEKHDRRDGSLGKERTETDLDEIMEDLNDREDSGVDDIIELE